MCGKNHTPDSSGNHNFDLVTLSCFYSFTPPNIFTFWCWGAVTSFRLRLGSETDVWGYYSGRWFCHVFCRLCQCLCWPRWHWCQHWASHLFSWSIKLASQFFLHKVPKVGHVLSGLVLIQLKLTLNRCKSKKWKFFQMIELTRNRKKSKTIR